jgi:hypothetical protein
MRFRLDPLGDHPQSQRMTHSNDRGCDGCVVGLDRDLPDEGAIDLQRIEGEVLQVAERGIPRPEVVHREV